MHEALDAELEESEMQVDALTLKVKLEQENAKMNKTLLHELLAKEASGGEPSMDDE